MKYRAVFFDAGETLIHPPPSFPELFGMVLGDAGHPTDPDELRQALPVVFDRFEEAARRGERWSMSPERSRTFWLSIYRDLLARLGLDDSEHLAERLYRTFTDLSNYRLFPDVPDALDRLHAAGLLLGLVSNFEAWLQRLLESLGVADRFGVVVISGVEGLEKPDPEIFRRALHRAGVKAEASVYVGDNPIFDVAPAAAVGMAPVLIDRRGRHPDHPGVRITTLADLPAAIGLVGI